MYARMVTLVIVPGKLDEAIQVWKEAIAPATQTQAGFVNARLFVNRAENKMCNSGLWESEAAFQASTQWSREQFAKLEAFFAAPPTIESYELITDVNAVLRSQQNPPESSQA